MNEHNEIIVMKDHRNKHYFFTRQYFNHKNFVGVVYNTTKREVMKEMTVWGMEILNPHSALQM